MALNFRFAVVSDLHIALPPTIWEHPNRFHLVEVSIPALEQVLTHIEQLDLDFLLLPGDLTQHGESENHSWLATRLSQLPFPVYVVPGNHDVPRLFANQESIGLADFPAYYGKFGYSDPHQLYYTCEVLPGVRLIGLNSNQFDTQGYQLGCLDEAQLQWLDDVLENADEEVVMVMVHHNVVEHLPNQASNPLGRRYMLDNAATLLQMLHKADVQLVFTGHLHVQDIARWQNVYDITTGSLVSYPHPYRVLNFHTDGQGRRSIRIESSRVTAVPEFPKLQEFSREWMGDRSQPLMLKLLTESSLGLSLGNAKAIVPHFRYFWADIAAGDAVFDFSNLPSIVSRHFASFGAIDQEGRPALIDNCTTLSLL